MENRVAILEKNLSYCELDTMPGGIRRLSVGGGWSDEIRHALLTVPFDALKIGGGMEGGLLGFEPFAEKIRWLWGGRGKGSVGLEKLKFIERINSFDEVPEPPFDYRQLKRLKAFSTSAACVIPPKFLNHPNLELLDLESFEFKDLTFLSEAKKLRALRLVSGPLKTLAGSESLSELQELRLIHIRSLSDISALSGVTRLEVLELDATPKISDISSVYGLSELRWLSIDGRKAKQSDLSWLRNMPRLECAAIYVETESIDWSVFADHPRLYDVTFYTNHAFVAESDEVIISKLSASGKKVKSFKRFPKDVFPAFAIEFEPASEITNPMPCQATLNHLRYLVE